MNYKDFKEFCDFKKIEYKIDEPMSEHTSFKIGGKADLFVPVKNDFQLSQVFKKINELEIPFFVIGNGSNLLVSDKGIRGVVISLSSLCGIEADGERIIASAGTPLMKICKFALKNCLEGLEFAYGIPGACGGALYMNAGAYGGEMSQVVESAEYIDSDGNLKTISLEEMNLGYRKSIFKNGGMIITKVIFKLKKGDKEEIKAKMDDFLNRRKEKQPLNFPSAGSFFKRPEGHFAGALIEKNNLKGFSVGGAEVSEKHAGFIINTGNATCNDVINLMKHIKKTVLEKEQILLEEEVIFVGEK